MGKKVRTFIKKIYNSQTTSTYANNSYVCNFKVLCNMYIQYLWNGLK